MSRSPLHKALVTASTAELADKHGVPAWYFPGEGKWRNEAQKAEAGWGSWVEGCEPLTHQLERLGERCKLPQQGPGPSPGTNEFLYNFDF